jgi:hypothetical protein
MEGNRGVHIIRPQGAGFPASPRQLLPDRQGKKGDEKGTKYASVRVKEGLSKLFGTAESTFGEPLCPPPKEDIRMK